MRLVHRLDREILGPAGVSYSNGMMTRMMSTASEAFDDTGANLASIARTRIGRYRIEIERLLHLLTPKFAVHASTNVESSSVIFYHHRAALSIRRLLCDIPFVPITGLNSSSENVGASRIAPVTPQACKALSVQRVLGFVDAFAVFLDSDIEFVR